MGWLLELLFESVNEMCSKFIVDMMDLASGMFTEILSCDLNLFEELFGVAGDLYRNAIVPMGVALLLMILVWQLFKSMFGKLGTASEDPVELVFRSCMCLFMILFAKDIVNYILEIAGTPYDWIVGTTITVDSFSEYVTTAEGIMSALGVDVLTISLLKLLLQLIVAWNYFKLLFILAERYVLLGIFSYTSPLAFASGGSKATNNVLGSWTKMFGGQVLVVILDAWCVKMFLSAYGNMMASTYGFTKFFAANMCLIGFCKITAKLDSYMGSLGVNLGRIGGGMSGMGALLMAGRLMNFGGGRKSAGGGGNGGHMNFSSGKTIPLGNGGPGFGAATMAGGAGQPGGGIGGMGEELFGNQEPEVMGNGNKPGEDTGFGEFAEAMEPAKKKNLPFGMPEEDKTDMAMGTENGMEGYGSDGLESGPFGSLGDYEDEIPGVGFDREQSGMEPFGQSMSPEDTGPFDEEMGLESGGIPMEPEELFEGAMGMESGLSDMGGEMFGSGLEDFEEFFGDSSNGFSGGMSDVDGQGVGYGGTDMDTEAGEYGAGGILGSGEPMGIGTGGISGNEDSAGNGVSEHIGLGVGTSLGMDSGNGISESSKAMGTIPGAGVGNGVLAETSLEPNAGSMSGMISGTGNRMPGQEGLGGSGMQQSSHVISGNRTGAEGGMAVSYPSGAGNTEGTGHGFRGSERLGDSVPGVYRAERDGEGYMRYDASQFERPKGDYQTIHENGKTYYELPETEKAPGVLPETRATLEKDGTIRIEKIYKDGQAAPAHQAQKQELENGEEKSKQKPKSEQKRKSQRNTGKGQSGKER